jgi:CheY-like chemotaxis protein
LCAVARWGTIRAFPATEGSAMATPKILHVDDDERVLRTVARFLEGAGFTVISTTSPFIAPLIYKERPQVLVMDIDMPLLSGDKIVSIIRGNEFSTLPVVYFSGKSPTELAAFAAKTQPASHVQKDQGLPALVEKLRAYTSP